MNNVIPCVSGPKRPLDKIWVSDLKSEFRRSLTNKKSFNGFGLKKEEENKSIVFTHQKIEYLISHGSVVIAEITSCTNTSNPSVMLAAGKLILKIIK